MALGIEAELDSVSLGGGDGVRVEDETPLRVADLYRLLRSKGEGEESQRKKKGGMHAY